MMETTTWAKWSRTPAGTIFLLKTCSLLKAAIYNLTYFLLEQTAIVVEGQ